jgi:nucleotide-binding universal stress UspA family protein
MLWVNTPELFKSDKSATEDLIRYAEKTGLTNFDVTIRSDYTPEAGILQFSREVDADMIAMGTHAWKGLIHLFFGSVAEHVVGRSNVPVWTVDLK